LNPLAAPHAHGATATPGTFVNIPHHNAATLESGPAAASTHTAAAADNFPPLPVPSLVHGAGSAFRIPVARKQSGYAGANAHADHGHGGSATAVNVSSNSSGPHTNHNAAPTPLSWGQRGQLYPDAVTSVSASTSQNPPSIGAGVMGPGGLGAATNVSVSILGSGSALGGNFDTDGGIDRDRDRDRETAALEQELASLTTLASSAAGNTF
jgi:hypothetical protein